MIAELIQEMIERGVPADIIGKTAEAFALNATLEPTERSAGAIRQARYRENRRNESVTSDACDVTLRNTVTKRNENLDKEIPPTPPKEINTPVKEKPPKGVKKKKHPLPESFVFSETVAAVGREHGFSQTEIENELAAMRDWAAAKHGLMADWNAFAKNWLRRNANQPRAGPQNFQNRLPPFNQGKANDRNDIAAAIDRNRARLGIVGREDFGPGNGITIDVTPERS